MQQFTIQDSGKISESAVLSAIDDLRQDVAQLDETAVEAHMMMFRAYAAYFTTTSAMYERLGLSHARFNMLRLLYHAAEHRLTVTELGASIEASVPNVIRMAQALESDGWVERIPSESDRRVVYVKLTEEGIARFRGLLPDAVQIWEDLQQGLTAEEQSILSHLLSKLRLSLLSRYIGKDLLSYRIEHRKRRGRLD